MKGIVPNLGGVKDVASQALPVVAWAWATRGALAEKIGRRRVQDSDSAKTWMSRKEEILVRALETGDPRCNPKSDWSLVAAGDLGGISSTRLL